MARGRGARGLGWKALVLALSLGAVVLAAGSALGSVREGTFTEGSLQDVSSGRASMSLGNAKPGDSVTACITVDSPASSKAVLLYGETDGADLAPYLDLVVTIGTMPERSSGSCDGFQAEGSVDRGDRKKAAIYRGTLAGFPGGKATALRTPPVEPAKISGGSGQHRAYRFDVVLEDDNAAQGKRAVQTFVWEASP